MSSIPAPARVIVGVMLFLVPATLLTLAVPRFQQGLQIEAVNRVTLAATGGQALPISLYDNAAAALGHTPSDDGEVLAWRAEFLALGTNGTADRDISRMAILALLQAPVQARAWMVLCRYEAMRSPARGVTCLDKAFPLTRFDWFTARGRMLLIASEWPYLDEDLRDKAAAMILPMWNTTQWTDGSTLRYVLFDLSLSDNGRQLLRAGLFSDRQALRDFNRWVLQERINGP